MTKPVNVRGQRTSNSVSMPGCRVIVWITVRKAGVNPHDQQGAGQQPPLPGSDTDGGGQLMAIALLARAVRSWPAAQVTRFPDQGTAAGSVPLRHLGSLHSRTDTAAGGTPLMQSG